MNNFLAVRWRLLLEQLRVCCRFYRYKRFRQIDKALLCAYRFRNPYTISRKFLQARGEKEVHLYGETPLTTYQKIAQACDFSSGDSLLELGCGRGRGLFFLSEIYGMRVHGIEWIPEFVETAQTISKRFSSTNITLSCEDFIQANFTGYTYIYLYGTCLKDQDIDTLCTHFLKLPDARFISISYPLTEYHPSFIVEKEIDVVFPWGETTAYIQHVRPS